MQLHQHVIEECNDAQDRAIEVSQERCDDRLDEPVETFSIGELRLSAVREVLVLAVTQSAERHQHRAGVAERVLFATRNSLKLHAGQNLKSPIRNIRAITLRLRTRSRRTRLATQRASNLGAAEHHL